MPFNAALRTQFPFTVERTHGGIAEFPWETAPPSLSSPLSEIERRFIYPVNAFAYCCVITRSGFIALASTLLQYQAWTR